MVVLNDSFGENGSMSIHHRMPWRAMVGIMEQKSSGVAPPRNPMHCLHKTGPMDGMDNPDNRNNSHAQADEAHRRFFHKVFDVQDLFFPGSIRMSGSYLEKRSG